MSGVTTPPSSPSPAAPNRKRRLRDTPLWAWVVIALAVSLTVAPGVFAVANYINDRTTVTIDLVSWSVPVDGTSEYIISCQTAGSFGPCPYRASPGSNYGAPVYLSGYFSGKNVNLTAPLPFHLRSTAPELPALVPTTGLTIWVNLTLPSTPGEYSFTGNIVFS